jgi:transcriptional regulator with XRE-family HTH domain
MSPMTLDKSGVTLHEDPLRARDVVDDGHRELTAVEIGETVRKYRIKRGMRQGDLAEKAGLSTSFISQFERGITDASISSLTRMCFALGITVGSLFNTETSGVHVLPVENTKAIELERAIKRVYSRPSLQGTDVYTVDLQPDASTGQSSYEHELQHELVVCMFGFIAAEIDGNQHVLRPGDSIDFPSERPHRLVNIGSAPAKFVWVIIDK